MKLLIATPAYGGLVTAQYLQSMIMTTSGLLNDGISFSIFTMDNESLISRARNKCAMYALQHGFTRLFFIDADISWKYEDFKLIIESNAPIIGGTYPVKTYPINLNFNPLDGNEFLPLPREEKNFIAFRDKYADKKGEVEVKHIPTGFMSIQCSVFKRLIEKELVAPYEYREMDEVTPKPSYDFFPVRVVDGQHESEDWAFCSLAREAGYKIILNTKVVTGHTGTHHFRMS